MQQLNTMLMPIPSIGATVSQRAKGIVKYEVKEDGLCHVQYVQIDIPKEMVIDIQQQKSSMLVFAIDAHQDVTKEEYMEINNFIIQAVEDVHASEKQEGRPLSLISAIFLRENGSELVTIDPAFNDE